MNHKDAYQLFHEGNIALAKMTYHGMRVDIDYCHKTKAELHARAQAMEDLIFSKDIGKKWKQKFGNKTSLGSSPQLRWALYEELGYTPEVFTQKGLPATNKEALAEIDHPLCKALKEWGNCSDLETTYLDNIIRETNDDGFLRPDFWLTTTASFRSSSTNPNFQNMPKRDKALQKLIRTAILPRGSDYRLCELDFKSLEVGIGCCFHQDKTMLHFLETGGDMHMDSVLSCYRLNLDECTKAIRAEVKGAFVFASFYGSFWAQTALALWKVARDLKTSQGIPLIEHLRSKGILELGAIDMKDNYAVTPELEGSLPENCFYNHIKEVERELWFDRFPGYMKWKKDIYAFYLEHGYVDNKTGFRFGGVYNSKQIHNYPIQSSAFHCNLWCIIQITKELQKRKMRTRLIGQIHDSVVADIHKDELYDFLKLARDITDKMLPETWKWITAPIGIEAEVAPVGASWFELEPIELPK
jgi:DNA polymerase-1